jgi:hypothetical protein
MNTTLKPKLLTYLGAIPFILALAIACYGYFDLSELTGKEIRFTRFKSYMMAHTYGAVIVAFLAGIQWGVSLNQPTDKQYFIISNVLALMAWISLFSFASFSGVATILAAFLLALIIDKHAHQNGLIPTWFWLLRIRISIIVISSLLLMLFINR